MRVMIPSYKEAEKQGINIGVLSELSFISK